jgi:hypothetical protein
MRTRWQQSQVRTLPGRKLASCKPPPKSLFERLDRFSRHFVNLGEKGRGIVAPPPPLLRMNLQR